MKHKKRKQQLYKKFIREATKKGQKAVLAEMKALGTNLDECRRAHYGDKK